MKKLIFILSALGFLFSSTAPASDKETELKPIALQVVKEARAIADKAGGIQYAENPTKASYDLHQRRDHLEKTAEPLGTLFDRPYGRCGELAKSLYGYINAKAGFDSMPHYAIEAYHTALRDCEAQIDGKDKPDPNKKLMVLEF